MGARRSSKAAGRRGRLSMYFRPYMPADDKMEPDERMAVLSLTCCPDEAVRFARALLEEATRAAKAKPGSLDAIAQLDVKGMGRLGPGWGKAGRIADRVAGEGGERS